MKKKISSCKLNYYLYIYAYVVYIVRIYEYVCIEKISRGNKL